MQMMFFTNAVFILLFLGREVFWLVFFSPEHAEVLSAWLVFLHNMTIISVVPVMTVNSFPAELCTLVTSPLQKSSAGSSTVVHIYFSGKIDTSMVT